MNTHVVNNFSNTAVFNHCTTITNVDLHNIPFMNNEMNGTFHNCINLQTITNINNNIVSMYQTFMQCYNLVNAPTIPNSVTQMYGTFAYCNNIVNVSIIPNSVTNMGSTFNECINLVNAPTIPNSVTDMSNTFFHCTNLMIAPAIPNSVTNMFQTFSSCISLVNIPTLPDSIQNMQTTFNNCQRLINAPIIPNSVTTMYQTFRNCINLTGNVNIYSNQVTNAINCFIDTTLAKNVYIPFTYDNGVSTTTYNSFTAAGYDTLGTLHGVYLKDLIPPISSDWTYTVYDDDSAKLTDYTGDDTDIVVPDKVEGDL